MAEAPVWLSPRALTHPELRRTVLDAYVLHLDSARAGRGPNLSFTQVLACLNQIGIRMRRGGRGPNRRAGFEEDNPSERLDAIRHKLEAARLRRLDLVEEGTITEARLAELEKSIRGRPFVGAAHCSVEDYRTTLATCLRSGSFEAAATELGITSGQLFVRLDDMGLQPQHIWDWDDPGMKRLFTALAAYLEVAVLLDAAPLS
jgi:hypothetical protein